MSGNYDTAVEAMQARIAPMVPDLRLPYPRWIITPDGDLGGEWCSTCGYYKWRHLRRHDRRHAEDYILDGGWRTEEEHFCFCRGCGVRLDVCLLPYGVEEAIACFEQQGFTTSQPDDAYEISEILGTLDYRSDDEKEETVEQRAAALAIAERFLAQAGQ